MMKVLMIRDVAGSAEARSRFCERDGGRSSAVAKTWRLPRLGRLGVGAVWVGPTFFLSFSLTLWEYSSFKRASPPYCALT